MALQCGECFKPRCVYSNAKHTSVEKSMLCELEEEYMCGDILFPPASEYHAAIVTRASLTCQEPVEPQ